MDGQPDLLKVALTRPTPSDVRNTRMAMSTDTMLLRVVDTSHVRVGYYRKSAPPDLSDSTRGLRLVRVSPDEGRGAEARLRQAAAQRAGALRGW